MVRKPWLALTLLAISSADASDTIPVLDEYPACNYEVVNELESRHLIRTINGQYTQKEVDRSFDIAKQILLDESGFRQGQGLVLTKRLIINKDNTMYRSTSVQREKDSYLVLMGELITLCHPQRGMHAKLAPLSSDGQRQLQVNTDRKREYSLDISFMSKQVENSIEKPPFITDYAISAETGVYGAKLGDSLSAVLTLFGKPTTNIYLNEAWRVLGFGRSHWFYFENDILKRVEKGNGVLTRELTNLIPFDERFDSESWFFESSQSERINHKSQLAFKSADERVERTVMKSGNKTLELVLSEYLQMDSYDKKISIEGFSYYDKTAHSYPALGLTDSSVGSEIEEWLANRENTELLALAALNANYLGTISIEDDIRYLIFDNHLVMRAQGDAIDKILLLESVATTITGEQTASPSSTFLGLKLGDLSSDVVASAEGDVFEFGDTIEITAANHTKNVYLKTVDGQDRVYQVEVVLY